MKDKIFLAEYKKLNVEQKKAVDEIEGPVMVIAGPGTGKTQILAMRIAQILRKTQTNPTNILCMTFTNSGVQAVKERLLEIIGPPAYQVRVHTIHSFCNEIINTFPEKFLTAKIINQLDDLERIFLIQKILEEHHFEYLKPLKAPFYYQKAILNCISKLKQENISSENFKTTIHNRLKEFENNKRKIQAKNLKVKKDLYKNKELATIYHKYQKNLEDLGKYDYDDMILFVVKAFQTDEELLSHYQEQFQYILIDEYQDTNSAQNTVIEKIASFYDEPNLFVVGDDEQSIYRFQGASLENILLFKNLHSHVKIIFLKDNYRSGQKILDTSRELIRNNRRQLTGFLKIKKNLKSQKPKVAGEIYLGQFSSGAGENYFISQKIKELISKKVSPSEIAVLYRQNRDVKDLAELFSRLNIPYQLEMGENVLDDPEIGKFITILKALDCYSDADINQDLLEILHYSFFNLSELDIYKVVVASRTMKKNLFDILSYKRELKKLELEKPKQLEKFVDIFRRLLSIFYNNPFAIAFEKALSDTGFLMYLLSDKNSVNHLNRLQSLFEYIKILNTKEKKLNLKSFLEHLSLLEENELKIKEADLNATFSGVNLMTAHKSKGLEFDWVFIIRFVDKHWGNKNVRELIKLPPNLTSGQIADEENDEEERRLFYVTLTRAKKGVIITSAVKYGANDEEKFSIPSKFIGELPEKQLKIIETKAYEKEFEKRLKTVFTKRKWHPSKALNMFLKKLIFEFRLNPTALNTFLECPQRFFFDNLLRVPKAKDFSQSYGTAIHSALEMFFKKFQKDLKLPPKTYLLSEFKEGLNYEILSVEDLKRALKSGQKILSQYYDLKAEDWRKKGIPISAEYSFTSHDVHFGTIPITGIIDKIELIDSISNKVRIVDYKTSSPKSLNQIMGLTKEKDLSLFNQAYFYKLLADTDPLFRWQVGEIVFDFISGSGFEQVALKIDDRKYQEFKKLVEETYKKITHLDFPHEFKSCQKYNRTCDYQRICQMKTAS